MQRSEDVKRVKTTQWTPTRSVSPRLNQLLQLFQSKSQDYKPKGANETKGTTSKKSRNFPQSPSGRSIKDHSEHSEGKNKFQTSRNCWSYPSYHSSLKKCADLDTRLGSASTSEDRPGPVCYPYSNTPYARDRMVRRHPLSRQKSFQNSKETSFPRKDSSSDERERLAEQLKSVNFLLKGSSRSFSQESKDQGYCTDTSIRSLDNERNLVDSQEYCLKSLQRPQLSLDDIMKAKLSLEDDDKDKNNKQDNQGCEQFEVAETLLDKWPSVTETKKGNGGDQCDASRNNVSENNSEKHVLSEEDEKHDRFVEGFRARCFTDSIPRNKKRKPLTRSRSAIIMKPPRRLCVNETDGGLQLDENGFLQIVNDIKSMKTCLLKLKRELQEAPVLSPLSGLSTGSQRFFDDSFITSSSTSLLDTSGSSSSPGPRKLVRRTTVHGCGSRLFSSKDTLDKESNTVSESSLSFRERKESFRESISHEDSNKTFPHTEWLPSVFEEKEDKESKTKETNAKSTLQENEQLKAQIAALKEELEQVKQERNCHMIAREELEHELNAKNYTIKLLQTQLEGQESRNEVQSLKEQIKGLKGQLEGRQDEIFEHTCNGPALPAQSPSDNLKNKNYWSKLRVKLKDAMITTKPQQEGFTQYEKTPSGSFSKTNRRAIKKCEVE